MTASNSSVVVREKESETLNKVGKSDAKLFLLQGIALVFILSIFFHVDRVDS